MRIEEFLALFSFVKPTKKGWDVHCPAHDDRHPSLGVMEGEGGRIVLNCLAHCTPESICAALGRTLADLFPYQPKRHGRVVIPSPPIRRRTPAGLAFAFDLHALDLRQHAEKILAVASRCQDCDTWTDEDRDLAMHCVAKPYAAQERAAWCEEYADHLRMKGIRS